MCLVRHSFHLQLSDNGYITLRNPLRSNRPRSFPIATGSYTSRISRMVAPYWSDIDTRCGGDIWFRQVTLTPSNDLFTRIFIEVSSSGAGADFKPTSAFIVTWEGVMSQNRAPCRDQRVRKCPCLLHDSYK